MGRISLLLAIATVATLTLAGGVASAEHVALTDASTEVEHRGDVVDLSLDVADGDETRVAIRGPNGRYNVTVQVQDDGDGHVAMRFNTYLAGSRADQPVVTATSAGDEVTDVVESGSYVDEHGDDLPQRALVGAGTWAVRLANASDGHAGQNATLGTVELVEPDTWNVTVRQVPAGVDARNATAGELRRSVGEMPSARWTSFDDTLVIDIEGEGFEGLLGAADDPLAALTDPDTDEGIHLTVWQRNPGPGDPAQTVEFDPTSASVRQLPAADRYLVVLGSVSLDPPASRWEKQRIVGKRMEARLILNGTTSLGRLESEQSRGLRAGFTLLEPTADFDTDDGGSLVYSGRDGASLTARTSLAVGTNVTVEVWEPRTGARVVSRHATVGADDTVRIDVPFGDVTPGTTIEAAVYHDGDVLGNASGVVGPSEAATVTLDAPTAGTDSVVLDRIWLEQDGFVRLHAGSPNGSVVGETTHLAAGYHDDVRVRTDRTLGANDLIVAVPYRDETASDSLIDGLDDRFSETAAVSLGRVTVESAVTATPQTNTEAVTTGTPPSGTTPAPGPGLGVLTTVCALLVGLLWIGRRS